MQNYKDTSQAILQSIEQANTILLISHKKPDADTLGSNLALYQLLKKKKNKNVSSFCIDPVPKNLEFMPYSHKIEDNHLLFRKKFDLIIAVDSGSLEYAGVKNLIDSMQYTPKIINIDHHASNPYYGDINLVIKDASSACEIIHRLFKDWNVEYTKEIAENLACGLITDTGGFKNPATSYQCLKIAGKLNQKGANIHKIVNKTLNSNDITNLKLWGIAFSRIEKIKKYDLVYTHLTKQDLKDCNANINDTEGLVNFLHIIKEGKITMVLQEDEDGYIKGSLRTTKNINLAKLAQALGGGGHEKAAGFTLSGRLEYVKNKLKVI